MAKDSPIAYAGQMFQEAPIAVCAVEVEGGTVLLGPSVLLFMSHCQV